MSGAAAAEAGCLQFPLTRYPGLNPFTRDWLAGSTTLLERRVEAAPAARPARAADPALAAALIASNRQWGRNVAAEVERWARGGTFSVIAGQQVGFAGGPIYTLAKLAGMLKLKRDNEARGIPTTVFFWLATEDHDFAEVATLSVPARAKQQLDLLRIEVRRGDARHSVGALPIPDELSRAFIDHFGISRPAWLRDGITFRDSFAELITEAAGEHFILVDALLPELRRAGAPLFERINAQWDDVQRSLAARSAEIERAGYTPQVVPRPGEAYSLLFELHDDGRRELLGAPRPLAPERTSTSALTRPLLQDFVLRPDLFVGGPSEVAYYAQIAPLHELLGVEMPRVGLRAHELLAPRRVVRTMERCAIAPEEVFAGADALLAEREAAGVAEVRAIADEARRDLADKMTRIGELALPAEHALSRAINKSIGHIEYHFEKLTERAIRGLVRKDRERWAAVRDLAATLNPDGTPQDRVTGWIAYWLEYGASLMQQMVAEAEQDAGVCKVVSL